MLKRIPGHFTKWLGLCLFLSSVAFIVIPVKAHTGYGLVGIGFVLLPFGLFLYRRGKQILAQSLYDAIAKSGLPPVLYLRSFLSDNNSYSTARFIRRFLLFLDPFAIKLTTEEEEIKSVMEELGPFVALGNPNESLPTLGAARLYIKNEEWQTKVLGLIDISAFILIRAEGSENLWWEINTAIVGKARNRIFFLLPGDQKKYLAFKEKFEATFPKIILPQPDTQVGNNMGFMHFDELGTPKINWIRNSFVDGGLHRNILANNIKTAMSPVLADLGISILYNPATFFTRVKSTSLDAFVTLILVVLGHFAIVDYSITAFIYYPVVLLMPLISELFGGLTLGKWVFNLRAVDESQTKASIFQLYTRVFLKYLLSPTLFYFTLPYTIISKGFFYDKWTKTTVVINKKLLKSEYQPVHENNLKRPAVISLFSIFNFISAIAILVLLALAVIQHANIFKGSNSLYILIVLCSLTMILNSMDFWAMRKRALYTAFLPIAFHICIYLTLYQRQAFDPSFLTGEWLAWLSPICGIIYRKEMK